MEHKVNLFIVGAMKAGTTSFNQMLSMHPSIYYSPIKEPNYFVNKLPKTIYEPSRFFNIANYFESKFPESLHIANIDELAHYTKLFSLANEKHTYLAEGSTAYLHAQESAQKIYDYNPKAKIIIVLRDPLKRAFSHYKMDLGLGRTKKDFQTVLDENIKDFHENKLSNWSYLGMSLYAENIKKYKDFFKENVLTVNFEDLIKNKDETLKSVFQFLNIEGIDLEIPHANVSATLKHQKVLFFLKKAGFKDFFSLLIPKSIRHLIFRKLSNKKKLNINLKAETLKELKSIFEKENVEYKKKYS